MQETEAAAEAIVRAALLNGQSMQSAKEAVRRYGLTMRRIKQIRDEISQPDSLKVLANGPLLNAEGPPKLRAKRSVRPKPTAPVQLSILDICDGHMGRAI